MEWKAKFIKALEQQSINEMVNALELQTTKHAGTAPANVKQQAIKLIRGARLVNPFLTTSKLCLHESPTAQEIGAILLTDVYLDHTTDVQGLLYKLADSPNWEVREWVASACGVLVAQYFDTFFPEMTAWSKASTENHRRAVVLAIMYAGKSRNTEFIEPFLNTLELLLSDRSRYVRDNLGPFAIGSALIRYYPEQVLERLQSWMKNENEQVRWNIAMIFSGAEGAKYASEAEEILETLKSDQRPYVKRAVNKVLKAISKIRE